MVLSFYGRCCLGLALISAVGLSLASADDISTQLDLLLKKLSKLEEDVQRNYELIKSSTSEILKFVSVCHISEGNLLCRTTSPGADWIVVQQRFDDSVDFNRNWTEYREGFGEVGPNSEFWWGLEKLHQHTKDGKYELLVELRDENNEYRFARYAEFIVEGESDKYRLAKLDGHSGTARDIYYVEDYDWKPNRQAFSTYDQDNDARPDGSCVQEYGGGWWYRWCGEGLNSNRMKWQSWKDEKLSFTRMMIRPRASK